MRIPPLDAGGLLRRLHEARVEYVVIGGLAVMAHGVQRFTKDLDICPAPDLPNLERLARMLDRADTRQLGLEIMTSASPRSTLAGRRRRAW